jgi:hypothetical protein
MRGAPVPAAARSTGAGRTSRSRRSSSRHSLASAAAAGAAAASGASDMGRGRRSSEGDCGASSSYDSEYTRTDSFASDPALVGDWVVTSQVRQASCRARGCNICWESLVPCHVWEALLFSAMAVSASLMNCDRICVSIPFSWVASLLLVCCYTC